MLGAETWGMLLDGMVDSVDLTSLYIYVFVEACYQDCHARPEKIRTQGLKLLPAMKSREQVALISSK